MSLRLLQFPIVAIISTVFAYACNAEFGANQPTPGRLPERTPVPMATPTDTPTVEERHGESQGKPGGGELTPTVNLVRHLVFAGVDPLAWPWQAAIQILNLDSMETKSVLSGESADPALFSSGTTAFLFNRFADNQNFRRLSFDPTLAATVGSQVRFAGGQVGDPHDAVLVGTNRLLLAHYNEGRLVVINSQDGQRLEEVSIEWDLPDGVSLKPEALVPIANASGETFIVIVHQALALQSGLVTANGSQKAFLLRLQEGHLKPLDLDESLPKVQGIPLKGSFPLPVRNKTRKTLLLVSMCSRMIAPGGTPGQTCQNAAEEIDPNTWTAKSIWDFEGSGFYMNGSIAPATSADEFHASIDQKLDDGSFKKRVLRINPYTRSIAPVYDYEPNSGGFWGLFFDETRNQLLVGDTATESVGKWVVISGEGVRRTVPLSHVPYSGAWLVVPKP